MKEFNLAALAGQPVVTRDGREVKEIKHFKEVPQDAKCVAAAIGHKVYTFYKDGLHAGRASLCGEDLFMAEPLIVLYQNVYRSTVRGSHLTIEAAKANVSIHGTAIQKTTYDPNTGKVSVEIVHTYER